MLIEILMASALAVVGITAWKTRSWTANDKGMIPISNRIMLCFFSGSFFLQATTYFAQSLFGIEFQGDFSSFANDQFWKVLLSGLILIANIYNRHIYEVNAAFKARILAKED